MKKKPLMATTQLPNGKETTQSCKTLGDELHVIYRSKKEGTKGSFQAQFDKQMKCIQEGRNMVEHYSVLTAWGSGPL